MQQRKKNIIGVTAMVVVIVILFVIASSLTPTSERNAAKFENLEKAICDYAKTHGKAPLTLADLKSDPELILDIYDHPYDYQVEGQKVTITTFGGDKKQGGYMFKADKSHSFTLPSQN